MYALQGLLVLGLGACIQGSNPSEDLDWWQKTVVYQIYPRSFQDSDGDGVGDIQGIISRLDHFVYLGVECLWLSPIYRSPFVDHGYDISDHKDIDPLFGTLADFDQLVNAMHDKGMKLIMDYIPNHTSDKHPWFIESRKGGVNNTYADYYVWKEGSKDKDGNRLPPNNWLSIFGGSIWDWDENRGAYYLHQFVKEQPDLNWNNPDVIEGMEDIFRFWLERGVDGFRIDAINTLFENHYDRDEPRSDDVDALPNETSYLDHIYTWHQPQIHDITARWRHVFDEHEKKTGKHTFMVMEVYDESLVETMKYYHSGADMPFNFLSIMHVRSPECKARCFHSFLTRWHQDMPSDKWPNFVLSNHDNLRVTARKGLEYASALNILLLTLPGTPTTYQGEEIGQQDIWVSYEDTQDPWGKYFGKDMYEKYSRDPCRAPIQWSSLPNAGFSTAKKTWLPVHEDYTTRNIEMQRTDPSGQSLIQIYRQATRLRREPSFLNNHLEFVIVNDNILSYIRHTPGFHAYLVTLNLGSESSTDDYSEVLPGHLRRFGEVVLNSGHIQDSLLQLGQNKGLRQITLHPGQAVVVRLAERGEL